MKEIKNPDLFWVDNVSEELGKHNIDPQFWHYVSMVRHSPIELARDVSIREIHAPHITIKSGSKGFLIVIPEAFSLSENDLCRMVRNANSKPEEKLAPASFRGIDHVVYLHKDDYKIVPPYYDEGLARCASSYAITTR